MLCDVCKRPSVPGCEKHTNFSYTPYSSVTRTLAVKRSRDFDPVGRAAEYWEAFYRRNGQMFYKRRHWLLREFSLSDEHWASNEIALIKPFVYVECGCGAGDAFVPMLFALGSDPVFANVRTFVDQDVSPGADHIRAVAAAFDFSPTAVRLVAQQLQTHVGESIPLAHEPPAGPADNADPLIPPACAYARDVSTAKLAGLEAAASGAHGLAPSDPLMPAPAGDQGKPDPPSAPDADHAQLAAPLPAAPTVALGLWRVTTFTQDLLAGPIPLPPADVATLVFVLSAVPRSRHVDVLRTLHALLRAPSGSCLADAAGTDPSARPVRCGGGGVVLFRDYHCDDLTATRLRAPGVYAASAAGVPAGCASSVAAGAAGEVVESVLAPDEADADGASAAEDDDAGARGDAADSAGDTNAADATGHTRVRAGDGTLSVSVSSSELRAAAKAAGLLVESLRIVKRTVSNRKSGDVLRRSFLQCKLRRGCGGGCMREAPHSAPVIHTLADPNGQ